MQSNAYKQIHSSSIYDMPTHSQQTFQAHEDDSSDPKLQEATF